MTTADAGVPPSVRTRVRRMAERGRYDRATLEAILDEAYVCHIAFADEHGTHCIPTACWREGDYLYIHGSNGSRMLKQLRNGAQACVTVTHLDGLVLARSAFHHSMNYRSAIIYGSFELVPDAHKAAAFETFLEGLAPGRQAEVRPGNAKELAATTLLRISLAEGVSKMRTGGPADDDVDLEIPVWAGVLPMGLAAFEPIVQSAPTGTPKYVAQWSAAADGRTHEAMETSQS
ncbi:Nitroimidazol reductase NimA, pyridoxamine 5'-phosphate oxidase superfamily [Pararobbsia alpina]|uniref:pyridoxamine 5'-phosphate oxidase family protein n=1 Tax=Pararobbsia alpina TaxID=621374 RepID=UPI0039A7864C